MLKWTLTRRSGSELTPKRPYRRYSTASQLQVTSGMRGGVSPGTSRKGGLLDSTVGRRRSIGGFGCGDGGGGGGGESVNRKAHRRLSMIYQANKENWTNGVGRSPGGCSLVPLQDLSNGQSQVRTPHPPQYACTLPSFDVEYSPCNVPAQIVQNNNEDGMKTLNFTDAFIEQNLSVIRSIKKDEAVQEVPKPDFGDTSQEESLSSSRIGDKTLDKMIDAIIESAKRDNGRLMMQRRKRIRAIMSNMNFPEEKSSHEDSPANEPSIHEMEVKTPDGSHLKRQRCVRRKTNKLIGLTLPNGIPSPSTPKIDSFTFKNRDILASMETPPRDMAFVVDSFPPNPLQGCSCSTPTLSRTNSIKRCLRFSPDLHDVSMDNKRASTASSSSTTTSMSSTSVSSLSGIPLGSTRNPKGSLDLAIFIDDDNRLNVHVIRCRDLQRNNGSTDINAYVKISVQSAMDNERNCNNDSKLQRTSVHRNSNRPFFDHRFLIDLKDEDQRDNDHLQLSVWHRDRILKRSEFLGCTSFPIRNVTRTVINGSFKLQSQTCLTNQAPSLVAIAKHQQLQQQQQQNQQPLQKCTATTTNCGKEVGISTKTAMAAAADRRRSSVEEDVISIDSASAAASHLIDANTGHTIALSKKAIHQRDADENLFLRFLELDPPPDAAGGGIAGGGGGGGGGGAANTDGKGSSSTGGGLLSSTLSSVLATTSSSMGTPQPRRMSTFKQSAGRTPFTITKKLTRTADKGFGFSIVWTHPPRVEKVEPGLSADRSGIVPGDYVIFVDKHNVVTMPEADVLNLIRSQGNSLTLEIFRRSGSAAGVGVGVGVPALNANANAANRATPATTANVNGVSKSRVASASVASNYTTTEDNMSPALKQSIALAPRSSTACSNASIETTKRRLHLPQVTFSKESIAPCHGVDDQRRRFLLQLISREQNFVSALQFGVQRFVSPLQERKDLISPNDHRTLFQNIDELIRISEDILEQLVQDDHEPQINFASRVYLSKTTAICAAYKKYCNGIKRADCVLVNKSRQPGSEFVTFITEPQVPRKRPDLTMFIHRPLQHFREILKLMQLLASHCRVDSEEHKNFTSVINELQAAYREITVGGGLMEPLGEGRPLLTLQDLESRMVFTRCKPFTLAVQGRQWIFGGDLSRVEGRSIKPYWTLLFSDILLFAKVSRDRVLFITEEPLPIVNIVDSSFNIRKKSTEFRITIDPNGRAAESPTAYCAPDLSRTPKKNSRRKSLILRAPSLELKAVWQNLLQRQIFLVNAALGSTPLSSPLDSPDVLNTLVPLSDIGATTTSMASIKLSSMDSINMKNQQKLHASQQIEQLIDEKCRILNKTGTPKGSALHLANWMKGQLDKQQEQARLAAESQPDLDVENDNVQIEQSEEEEERITYWTREQLEKRTKELNLAKENGNIKPLHAAFGGKRLSGVEEVAMSDAEEEVKSPSRSTTSDSQITVRSSPIANVVDKLSVCRHCHKNCKQKMSPSPPLLSNSLKVQHSQASPNRCCQISSLSNNLHINAINNNISSNTNINPTKTLNGIASTAASSMSSIVTDDSSQVNRKLISSSSSSMTPTLSTKGRPSSAASTTTSKVESSIGGRSDGSKLVCTESADPAAAAASTRTGPASGTATGTGTGQAATPSRSSAISRKVFLNGSCSGSESDRDTTLTNTTVASSAPTTLTTLTSSSSSGRSLKTSKILQNRQPHHFHPQQHQRSHQKFIPCNCKCTPEDFSNTTLSPDEVKQETCKIIEDVSKIASPNVPEPIVQNIADLHKNCKCVCKKTPAKPDRTIKTNTANQDEDTKSDDDLSLVLIGLAQFTPAAKLVKSDAFVPTISVVPPTPDAVLSKTQTNVWDNSSSATATKLTINNLPKTAVIENIPEDSPDESPQDEEPPYRSLNTTTLRRYGTLSSLEKLPTDDIDHDQETSEEDGEIDEDLDDDDIEVITREVFNNNAGGGANQTSLRNWTARAGSYVAEKMSFFEESRAFIDKYLGRWNQDQENDAGEEDQLDECTSGATSGEEVWGTPTSGGDNDDMQMLNSDHTQSSPTKSSSSLTGDDDTELMMDELLMAPPMTASTIRGLLPRRRLEPLFEEETESDEEKTQQENDVIKKGETSANGHDLEVSIGNLRDDLGYQRINLASMITTTVITMPTCQTLTLTTSLTMPRSSETLIDTLPISTTANTTSVSQTKTSDRVSSTVEQKKPFSSTTSTETTTTTPATQTAAAAARPTIAATTPAPTTEAVVSKAVTTTATATPITATSAAGTPTNVVRKAKFSPPPPPPRRLLLTGSDSKTTSQNQPMMRNQQQQTYSRPILQQSRQMGTVSTVQTIPTTRIGAPYSPKTPSNTPKRPDSTQTDAAKKSSNSADNCSSVAAPQQGMRKSNAATVQQKPITNQKIPPNIESSQDPVNPAKSPQQISTAPATTIATSPILPAETSASSKTQQPPETTPAPSPTAQSGQSKSAALGSGLSPRQEMRLALNHDILGDEDLIGYDPGPDLTTILGHDLSTFHRLTGRDLLNRSANRIQPKEAVISYSQQRNSKMDTPTLNRKRQQKQLQQQNQSTWSSSVYVDRIGESVINVGSYKSSNNSSEESRLSDLELLAKREKIYCTSQLRSGSPAKMMRSTTSMGTGIDVVTNRVRRSSSRDESAIMSLKGDTRASRFFNFLTRRNSENQLTKIFSRDSLDDSNSSSTIDRRLFSPRKDNDKPPLNRRFWKQLTKRRRAHSVSEIVAS